MITGLGDGGAESVLYRLICESPEVEHIVVSLTSPGKYGPLLEKQGIKVKCLGIRFNLHFFSKLLYLIRFIRSTMPDAVQTWMYHADLIGGFATMLSGCSDRLIWNIRHSDVSIKKNGIGLVLLVRLSALFSHILPKSVLSCSHVASDLHSGLGYCAIKMEVIPNGFDTRKFLPSTSMRTKTRSELGVTDDTFLIGMVARFNIQKDHEMLVSALKLLNKYDHSFKILLIGSGNELRQNEIEGLVCKSGLNSNVHFLGARNDLPALYNAMDLHVLSSSFGEGFPNVIGEAMACGVPCLATDVGDSKLIIDRTGWVTQPGDEVAFARAIDTAICEFNQTPVWLERKALARKRIVDKFEVSVMVKSYISQWESCSRK